MTSCPFVLLLSLTACWAALPNGYILEVEPECGYLDDEGAAIVVTTDLQIGIRALCEGSEQGFVSSDAVHYQLSVGYPGLGAHACSFKKSPTPNVYEMRLIISFGKVFGLSPHQDQEMTVTCSFDPRKAGKNGQGSVLPLGVLPLPIEGGSDPRLVLRILDESGQDVSGSHLTMGSRAVLKASIAGGSQAQGIRPVSCDAVGTSGERYAIIRAGCGEGIVFDSDSGFISHGNISTSPYFSIFRFPNADVVNFDCSFTLCDNTCDGSSCLLGDSRARRSERQLGNLVRAQSSKVSISRKRHSTNDTAGTVVYVKKPHQERAETAPLLYNPYFLTPVVILGAIALASCFIAVCACAKRNSSQLYEVDKEWTILDRYDIPFNSEVDVKSRPRNGKSKSGCIKNCDLQKCTCKNCRCAKHVCDTNCRFPCTKACGCSEEGACGEGNVSQVYESLYSNPWNPELGAADCLKPCNVVEVQCAADCLKPCNVAGVLSTDECNK